MLNQGILKSLRKQLRKSSLKMYAALVLGPKNPGGITGSWTNGESL